VKVVTIRKSECCRADTTPIDEVVQKQPWGESHYHVRCSNCKNPCHTKVVQMFDSAGVEIVSGDILEATDCGPCSPQWHAVYIEYGELTIRDLGNNNVAMWDEPIYTRGPYWRHLDKLNDEDLEHYWNSNRNAALKRLEEERGNDSK